MVTYSPRIVGALAVAWLAASPSISTAATVDGVTGTAGPTAGGGNSADVVAQAGSITLDRAEVGTLVAGLPSSERAAATGNLESLEQVIRADLVRRAVLAQAKASDFQSRPNMVAALARVRDDALVRLWIADQAAVPATYPDETEVKATYDANRQAMAEPTQYHVAQIFISAPDGGDAGKLAGALRKASDITGQIATGDFAVLAEKQSEDPQTASHRGDLGWLPENHILPEILTAVRNLSPGQVVGPVKTTQGLRFLKLLDKKTGAIPTLAEVHDRLVAALRNRRASQLEQAYLTQYNAKLGVTVNQIELAKLQQTLPR